MMEDKMTRAAGTDPSGSAKSGIYPVDLAGVEDREMLYQRLAEALPLPGYCGKNLDALYDVLTECASWDAIRFLHCDGAEAAMPEYFAALRAMCEDVCSTLEEKEITFDRSGQTERNTF